MPPWRRNKPQPAPGPVIPPVPPADSGCDCDKSRIEALEKAICELQARDASWEITEEQLTQLGQELYAQMQADPKFKGPAGSIDEADLRRLIKESLPSITIDVVAPDGSIARQTEDLSEGDAQFIFKFKEGSFNRK